MTPPRGWSAHSTVVLKVTVRGGQCHMDCGTGSTENQRTKSDAISLARKEAFTDARKRALKNFGNALGNSLYDREHLQYMQSARAAQYAAMDSVTDAVMREPMGGMPGGAGGAAAAMAAGASPVTPRGGGGGVARRVPTVAVAAARLRPAAALAPSLRRRWGRAGPTSLAAAAAAAASGVVGPLGVWG